ncbi:hypothetical protein CW304_26795 [Bacillus sp. UFRGS-B20]|nr:hypothetical protein CW304_26795 [Bacillus sp. UFRGS-B20]
MLVLRYFFINVKMVFLFGAIKAFSIYQPFHSIFFFNLKRFKSIVNCLDLSGPIRISCNTKGLLPVLFNTSLTWRMFFRFRFS